MGALGTHSLVISEPEPGPGCLLRSHSGPTHTAVSGYIILRNSHFGHSWFYSLVQSTTQVLGATGWSDTNQLMKFSWSRVKMKSLPIFCVYFASNVQILTSLQLQSNSRFFACHFTISMSKVIHQKWEKDLNLYLNCYSFGNQKRGRLMAFKSSYYVK